MSSPLDAKSPFSTLRLIISFVLVRTLLFVQAVPESWEAGFDGGGIPTSLMKYKFIDADERSMWISMLVLIARLGTSRLSVDDLFISRGDCFFFPYL